jgi:hypothetical protein
MQNNYLLKNWKKTILSSLLIVSLLGLLLGLFSGVSATVIDSGTNTITGANNNTINLSNAASYGVSFSLSGTLDGGNTLVVIAMDGSGKIATGSYLSPTGWESSGSVFLDFSQGGWLPGTISYSGAVHSGSIATAIVASGMTFIGTLDVTRPIVTLIWPANLTILQWSVYSESGASWTDNLDGTGTLVSASSGSVNTALTGSYILQYSKTDTAGNMSILISRTVTVIAWVDTTAPIISITSHVNNAVVTGMPTLVGTVYDTGWVASLSVNGGAALLGSGSWSKVLTSLVWGTNTLTILATDLAGNISSGTIILNRVSLTSAINNTLSGTSTAVVTFSTDISATGLVHYGTSIWALNMSATGSIPGMTHIFTLSGLLSDTIYYYRVEGQLGIPSAILQFKTPTVVTNNASGSIVTQGSVYLSGSTGTGIVFSASGTLTILSITSSGSSLFLPLTGLTITALGGGWDGIIQAPEMTGTPMSLTLSGYGFIGTPYQIGNPNTELVFSGQLATVNIKIGAYLGGQTIRAFSSIDHGITYTELTPCLVTLAGDCVFTTGRLSLFAFAAVADTTPDSLTFTSVTWAEITTQYISNTVILSGINAPTAISIVGGEYSINSGVFTTAPGTINSWNTLSIRSLSAASFSTVTNATVTIGGIAGSYSITTKAGSTGGSGGGGWWGGGWGGGTPLAIDICPGWDLSASYYDRICIAISNPGNVINPISIASFNIPDVILSFLEIKFRDISLNWARAYIIQIVSRGIIDNVTYYHPRANLTRAEFLKIVINTTGWDVPVANITIPFNDISPDSWYAPYTSLALSKGMIRSSARFRPDDSITRAEAAKILTLALWVTIRETNTMTFIDVRDTSDLAKYIEAATFLNIFSGQVRMNHRIFRPDDSITRAEIAKVVANAFGL